MGREEEKEGRQRSLLNRPHGEPPVAPEKKSTT
jgi:hypothetical protein